MKYAEINSKLIVTSEKHSKARCGNGETVILARSIKKNGIIEPITVKPLLGGGYEIISGNRRYCASRLAGIDKIPCIVLEKGDNPKIIEITQLIFNNHDAFEVADKIKRILIKSKSSAEVTASALGIEVPILLEYLSPVCMSEIERKIARENNLSNAIIRKISALPKKEDRFKALLHYTKINEQAHSVKTSKSHNNVKARRRASIKGLGFFENTLKRSLDILEDAGIKTSKQATERCGEIEYKITVKK